MIPASFEYFDPLSLDEAFSLLEKFDGDAKVLAGGQSLISLMKFRLARPKYVIDLSKIPGLSYVNQGNDGRLLVGARTTHHQVSTSRVIRDKYQVLAESAGQIGDFQIRNRGTIGGAICHADPAGNIPPAVLALEAQFRLQSKEGQRVMNAKDFFLDTFTTAIKPNEILVEIILPQPAPNSGSAYIEFNRRHGDFAIVSVSCSITLDSDGKCSHSNIVLGGVSSTPVILQEVSDFLIGSQPDENVIDKAIELVRLRVANPPTDIHSTSEHRRVLSKVLTKRAITLALKRIGGI